MPVAAALPPNPTWRSYIGGSVLRRFRGFPDGPDDHFPEDWLASTVQARNGANSQGPTEGLSMVHFNGSCTLLASALQSNPSYWWGPRPRSSTGVLWKLLDSSVRLQFQAHPDKAFARKHLNSNAGKTECWYILATRGAAAVYLGFQRSPGREAWGQIIRDQRVGAMLSCFDRIPVKPGDCFIVPAGTPHAIGAGVFMMELQEPTDWVVRCEQVNAGLRLPPEACFMGLDLERCLEVFDYNEYSVEQVFQLFRQNPRVTRQNATFMEEEIISPEHRGFFRLHHLRGTEACTIPGGELMLMVALKGQGRLSAGGPDQCFSSGETWLLPGSADSWDIKAAETPWEIMIARLPEEQDAKQASYP